MWEWESEDMLISGIFGAIGLLESFLEYANYASVAIILSLGCTLQQVVAMYFNTKIRIYAYMKLQEFSEWLEFLFGAILLVCWQHKLSWLR